MKLEIEIISSNTARISLDGKSIDVKSPDFGSGESDLTELPDDTIGKEILSAIWSLALNLLFANQLSNGSIWEKADEDSLDEIYEAFS